MNKNSTLCYAAAALFFISAILKIATSGFSSGIIWLCLGSAFLCLGAASANKNNPNDPNSDTNQE